MEGQMNFSDYTHKRDGTLYPAPEWMNKERCENCIKWHILPKEEQPPAGWGVKGQCNCIHDPKQKGYETTGKNSYCCDFEDKYNGNVK